MSPTLNEIAYNILNLYRGGRSSNNEYLSLNQIMFNVVHYRAMLLRRDFERNGMISRHAEQEIKCLDLVQVDASRCCGLPVHCTVVRTDKVLPRAIRFNRREAVTHVSDVTGLHTIPLVEVQTVQFLTYDRFTKNERKAYILQDHLYIYEPDGIEKVNVRMIAEDPRELSKYDCAGADCYSPDSPFPIPMDLVDAITQGLVSGTLKLLPLTASDLENDTVQDGKDAPVDRKG